MKVFTDYHHQGLLESLISLFENRLGGTLYRPIGLEWFNEGYWKINNLEPTAKQYLLPGSIPEDGTIPLNDDLSRTITLGDFKNTEFDIIIASLPQHIAPFRELIDKYQPQAKLIFQIGNAWNIEDSQARMIDGVMASALPKIDRTYLGHNGEPLHLVTYHQEFPVNVFYPPRFRAKKQIYSFINCLNCVDIYKKDWELFLELERLMPDWDFKSMGGQCRDGYVSGDEEVAEKMREATFGFHCKTEGDGYGHVIHNLARTGIPLIVRLADYKGKLAEPLLIDGETCIAVDGKTPQEIADQINYVYKTATVWKTMSQNLAKRFKQVVDFDKEEQDIRRFLEDVV